MKQLMKAKKNIQFMIYRKCNGISNKIINKLNSSCFNNIKKITKQNKFVVFYRISKVSNKLFNKNLKILKQIDKKTDNQSLKNKTLRYKKN